MEPLILHTARKRNLASLVLILGFLIICVTMVFRAAPYIEFLNIPFDSAFGDLLVRGFFAVMAAVASWGLVSDLDRLFFRTPIIYADQNGISVRGGAQTTWDNFGGVAIKEVSASRLFKINSLEVYAGRKHVIPSFQLSQSAPEMAAQVKSYVAQVHLKGATLGAPANPDSSLRVRPSRPVVNSRAGIRPGTV